MHADSTTRAEGIIVQVADSSGAVVARALSGDRGDFDVRLPRAGRFTVRALRIGFRPTVMPPVDVPVGAPASLRIVLSAQAIELEKVTVRGENVCGARPDSGQLVARLWEEARKAITATRLDAGGRRLAATWYVYDRMMDSAARTVRSQTVTVRRGASSHPFTSEPPESLARLGYVIQDGNDILFKAPDADALLSDSFAATHCFRVEPPTPQQPGWIGVGFRPARERTGIRDIEGAFWLDRTTAELRLLEFGYTNLADPYRDAGAGGRVEFLRLPTGAWLVNRWVIRTPVISVRQGTAFASAMRSPSHYVLSGSHFTGGEVTEVLRDGVSLHQGGGGTFRALALSRDSTVSPLGTTIDFDGTDYIVRADSAGLARIDHVLPGRYKVKFGTPEMAAALIEPIERDVEVREGRRDAVDTLALPTSEQTLSNACGRDAATRGEALLYGTVRGAMREALPGAVVTVSWLASVEKTGRNGIMIKSRAADITTDDLGRWRFCGAPRDWPILVKTTFDERQSEPASVRIPWERLLRRVEVSVPPKQ